MFRTIPVGFKMAFACIEELIPTQTIILSFYRAFAACERADRVGRRIAGALAVYAAPPAVAAAEARR